MKEILILFAHPAFKRSITNAALRKAVEGLEGITFHDLYSHYPDFLIDIDNEQYLCEKHDIIVLQHPFYWYSTPALLKEWFDLVLEHGWAYGKTGNALAGKYMLQALTAGGDVESYRKNGQHTYTIGELITPMRATANLCGMTWLPPFAILGVHRGLPFEEITRHAEDYRQVLVALRDERIDLRKATRRDFLNDWVEK